MVNKFDEFNNVVDLVNFALASYKDQPAFTCLGHTLTYQEVDELSMRFASYLQHELGLQPGDRVAIQLPNLLQYPVVLYGIARAGLVIVNANPLYTSREIRHQLKDSGAKLLIVLANVAANAAVIIEETDVENVIVTEIGDLLPWPKGLLVNLAVKYLKKMVPEFSFANAIPFKKTIAKPAKPLNSFEVNGDTLFVLQYTGGTTGVAKGAMLTHKNLCANSCQMMDHLKCMFTGDREIFIAPLPLYHIYAFNLHLLAGAAAGAESVLVPNPRDLDSLIKAMRSVNFSVFIGLNTLFNALTRNQEFQQLDFSHLKVTAAGGMATNADVAERWLKITGCEICEGYGLTETSPVISANRIENCIRGSIGTPVKDTEVRLLGEDDKEVSKGEAGEIVVRGPQVMKGYWQRPDETAKVFLDGGWFRTGDIAIYRDDGYLQIVDRKKDMILVSGFNVYPNEIEDVVMQHQSVVEAAVIGVTTPSGGEAVKLFVVSSDANLSKDELIDYCRRNLTAYKVPKIIEFRESLPKSNVGKILRRELREPEKAAEAV